MEAKDKVIQKRQVNKKVLIIGGMLALVIAIILGVLLFGSNSAKGTWELYSIEQGGNIIDGADLEAQYGGKVLYNLNSDGTLVVLQLGQEIEGTWTEEGNTVFFHYTSSLKELVRDGNTMVLEQNGGIYTFIR